MLTGSVLILFSTTIGGFSFKILLLSFKTTYYSAFFFCSFIKISSSMITSIIYVFGWLLSKTSLYFHLVEMWKTSGIRGRCIYHNFREKAPPRLYIFAPKQTSLKLCTKTFILKFLKLLFIFYWYVLTSNCPKEGAIIPR